MKKNVRKIHFWIGIIASLFLFIESLTGIVMYFNGEDHGPRMQGAAGFQRPNFQLGSTDGSGSANIFSQGGQTFDDGPRGNARFQGFNGNRGGSSLQGTVRSLHTGIIGLIASIGMLLMTGTGLWISGQIFWTRRKNKNRKDRLPDEPKEITT
ncbi:PepSY-associated TM helix domain-containing protein [Falsibacillus albus]|uniref:PepSY domain-containing protein n=1 Tax=Falsibacillus albus TaxID=2478915 RepID=A0A3L7K1H4_9BACI|nr:PepSY-associated TM helix domain-containing protein [Falsibacillus albus]RLQ96204.1 PepSY domain-containing protein [Falsibacillus albus]